MKQHPYRDLPDKAFWKRSVAAPARDQVDPVGHFDLRITPETQVATAGSCFAQHTARHLRDSGYRDFVAEQGHPALSPSVRQRAGYGLFSARYGNICSSRQLLQLFERAYGRFSSCEPAWFGTAGEVLDPLRPTVQPGGFVSLDEMLADRRQHLAAVRHMFETLDVFVFTLGLTECWRSRADGAVFPICPGVEGGSFSAQRSVRQSRRRRGPFRPVPRCRAARARQPAGRADPDGLAGAAGRHGRARSARAVGHHLLELGAAGGRRADAGGPRNIHCFPSYEIITGSYTRGAHYAEDRRNVVEAGVSHVKRLFLADATGSVQGGAPGPAPAPPPVDTPAAAEAPSLGQAIVDVECDESALDR